MSKRANGYRLKGRNPQPGRRKRVLQTMRQNGALNADEWRAYDNLNPIPGGKGKIFWQPVNMQELGKEPPPPQLRLT